MEDKPLPPAKYVSYAGSDYPDLISDQGHLWLGDFLAPGSTSVVTKLYSKKHHKIFFVPKRDTIQLW